MSHLCNKIIVMGHGYVGGHMRYLSRFVMGPLEQLWSHLTVMPARLDVCWGLLHVHVHFSETKVVFLYEQASCTSHRSLNGGYPISHHDTVAPQMLVRLRLRSPERTMISN
jgi:hypothetical protein